MKNRIFTIPNCLTFVRLVGAIILFFLEPFSTPFMVTYTCCGVTDALDGFIARSTHSTTALGARLDSIADIVFYSSMFSKIFYALTEVVPRELWYMVACILAIRVLAYITAAIKYGMFASLHTYMNKVTGAIVFLTPYCIRQSFALYFCIAVCIIALLASIEELVVHILNEKYNANIHSIISLITGRDRALAGNEEVNEN